MILRPTAVDNLWYRGGLLWGFFLTLTFIFTWPAMDSLGYDQGVFLYSLWIVPSAFFIIGLCAPQWRRLICYSLHYGMMVVFPFAVFIFTPVAISLFFSSGLLRVAAAFAFLMAVIYEGISAFNFTAKIINNCSYFAAQAPIMDGESRISRTSAMNPKEVFDESNERFFTFHWQSIALLMAVIIYFSLDVFPNIIKISLVAMAFLEVPIALYLARVIGSGLCLWVVSVSKFEKKNKVKIVMVK